MNYAEFENKVKSMTAHDIIMSMVDGLREPRTEIDMDIFGSIYKGICYGCAATNAVLRIMDANKEEVEKHVIGHASEEAYIPSEVRIFEIAIDWLRRGCVAIYNHFAEELGFATISPMPGLDLPRLENDYTEDQLQAYEKLAEYQLTAKTTKNELR